MGSTDSDKKPLPEIIIRELKADDVDTVRQIFVSALLPLSLINAIFLPLIPMLCMAAFLAYKAHTGLEGYIAWSLSQDLVDPVTFYSEKGAGAGSKFFIAEQEPHCVEMPDGEGVCKNRQIVGIVGLERKSDGVGELRRMSVTSEARGRGVGLTLALSLIKYAEESGMKTVSLSTSSAQAPAINLYEKLGWKMVRSASRFPIKECFMELDIAESVPKLASLPSVSSMSFMSKASFGADAPR
eukprot:gene8718-33699_t